GAAKRRPAWGPTLADVLEIFAGLEANGPPWRNANFFPGPRVAADAALAGFHLEHAEATELDALAPLHGGPHRVEYRIDRHLSFHLGDVGYFRHFVDDVDLDHA